jgi:type VI secretion system protein VasG
MARAAVLTEAVRRKPYSVVLLDEVEKAHPDVHEIFFQVFDKGFMEDGEGRFIDFKNTLILLTTNAGSELIMNMCKRPRALARFERLAKALREPLLKIFPPPSWAASSRSLLPAQSTDMLGRIVRLQLDRIKKRVESATASRSSTARTWCSWWSRAAQESESGGRMIDAILTNTMLPTISVEYLQRLASGGEIRRVALDVKDADFTYAFD